MTPRRKNNRHAKTPMGDLRIIGGQWKRTKLTFPLLDGVRPTPSRIRETLFNWLASDIPQSRCLDLFAGSGALGFEALSRGAKFVWMVDQAGAVTDSLLTQANNLDTTQVSIINGNALEPESLGIHDDIDIVFCDPPFNQNHLLSLLPKIETLNLAPQALVYVESERSLSDLLIPANWLELKNKTAGDVRYRLLQRQA